MLLLDQARTTGLGGQVRHQVEQREHGVECLCVSQLLQLPAARIGQRRPGGSPLLNDEPIDVARIRHSPNVPG